MKNLKALKHSLSNSLIIQKARKSVSLKSPPHLMRFLNQSVSLFSGLRWKTSGSSRVSSKENLNLTADLIMFVARTSWKDKLKFNDLCYKMETKFQHFQNRQKRILFRQFLMTNCYLQPRKLICRISIVYQLTVRQMMPFWRLLHTYEKILNIFLTGGIRLQYYSPPVYRSLIKLWKAATLCLMVMQSSKLESGVCGSTLTWSMFPGSSFHTMNGL